MCRVAMWKHCDDVNNEQNYHLNTQLTLGFEDIYGKCQLIV